MLAEPPDPALVANLRKTKLIRAAVLFVLIRLAVMPARVLLGFRARGQAHVPRQGACIISPNHQTYIDSQMKAGLTRISTALRESLDESLKALCSYYKVELEAKARKRALEAGVTLSDSVEEEGQSSEEEGDGALVH